MRGINVSSAIDELGEYTSHLDVELRKRVTLLKVQFLC